MPYLVIEDTGKAINYHKSLVLKRSVVAILFVDRAYSMQMLILVIQF